MMPSCPPRTGLELIRKWRGIMQDSMPRGWLVHDTGLFFTSRMGSNQRRWSCTNSETLQECVCHIAMWSMPNESAQLAQQADSFVRKALPSPRPPERAGVWGNVQTIPHTVIVTLCESRGQLRSNYPQLVIRACSGTVEQQGPCALNVLNERDAF